MGRNPGRSEKQNVKKLNWRRVFVLDADKCCANCGNNLGGGACRLNLEADCGKGEFEAWEPERFAGIIVEV
jgi:uncharacterized protein YjcR